MTNLFLEFVGQHTSGPEGSAGIVRSLAEWPDVTTENIHRLFRARGSAVHRRGRVAAQDEKLTKRDRERALMMLRVFLFLSGMLLYREPCIDEGEINGPRSYAKK
jgi:hypothetical protein